MDSNNQDDKKNTVNNDDSSSLYSDTQDTESISGDEVQRIAQDFATQQKQQSGDQASQQKASELEQEILSSFGDNKSSLDEAVSSLGDAGATEPEGEQPLDLDSAENLSDATRNLNENSESLDSQEKPNTEDNEPLSQASESNTSSESVSLNSQTLESDNHLSQNDLDDLPLSGMKKQSAPDLPLPQNFQEPQVNQEKDNPMLQAEDKNPSPEEGSLDNQEIARLEDEITSDLDTVSNDAETENERSDLGVNKTYYTDLGDAMSSNKPQTMSELLKKSAFEKKEEAVLSPTSRKNLVYIVGTILLLLISLGTWLVIFQPNSQPEFITEQRVSSLVYSDQDLGINITGLETFRTKEAIRDVIERDQSSDSLSQIYYVQSNNQNNLRRLGVKDIFDHTQNQTPELLYNNIENEFMHGVYTSDKNYPFIILKALSYDRAFDGMREWEPTMIDDLATYFDLPPEATDRSLLEDGFSDDLIENKNVRVARYIPRESDRRGILDLLNIGGNSSDNQTQTGSQPDINSPSPYEDFIDPNLFEDEAEGDLSFNIMDIFKASFRTPLVLAQNDGGIGGTFISDTVNQGGSTTVCYRSERKCIDLLTGQNLPGNTTPSTTVTCYDDIQAPNPVTGAIGEMFTPEEVAGQDGFVCREVLSGGDVIETTGTDIETLNTTPVCFDPITGNRIDSEDSDSDEITSPQAMCFTPYQCKRIACFQGNQEVSSASEGQPGVSCRVTNDVVEYTTDVRKSCVQFNELLTLQKLDNLNICFDEFGRFVSVNDNIQTLEDYYENGSLASQQSAQQILQSGAAFSCISPQSRNKRLCLTTDDSIIDGTDINPLESTGNDTVTYPEGIVTCFEPLSGSIQNSSGLSEMYETGLNEDIRALAATIAQQLELLAGISSGFGLFDNETSDTLDETAQVFWQIAYANILENEIIMTIASTTRKLEILLNRIEPLAPNSQVVLDLRAIIQFIKEALGLQYNVGWVTLAGNLPEGVNIYPGDDLATGEGIEAVQEALVLLGLLDPLSVSGELDLVTQQALATLQGINGVGPVGSGDGVNGEGGINGGQGSIAIDQVYIDTETLQLLQQMVTASSGIYNGGQSASIEDFFSEIIGLGAFNEEVMSLQVLLYGLGYDISGFDGIFDEEVCLALQQYQVDNDLEPADSNDCQVSPETMQSLNDTIRNGGYLGSGFAVNSNGSLEGNGNFLGTFGPGAVNFDVPEVEANSLREGDVVLLYTFLDEETILITRDEVVINEVIQRRALDDIFNG